MWCQLKILELLKVELMNKILDHGLVRPVWTGPGPDFWYALNQFWFSVVLNSWEPILGLSHLIV